MTHEVDQTMRPWNDKCPQHRINLSNSNNLSSIILSELLLLPSISYPISRAYITLIHNYNYKYLTTFIYLNPDSPA